MITLAGSLSTLPDDDGDHTETYGSYCNFNVNFNTFKNNSLVDQLVIKKLRGFPFVYNISSRFRLLDKTIIRLNHHKIQKCKWFLFLYLILFQPDDGCGKNPKYIDYCKETEILCSADRASWYDSG